MTTDEPKIETTQLYMIFIKGTPERIWKAITTPEDSRRYFHGTHVEVEIKKGGKFWFWSPDKSELWGDGEVLEFELHKRLVTTWHALWTQEIKHEKPSRVIWEIEPQEGGYCKVTVTHDKLEEAPITAKHVHGPGWTGVISGLKTVVETNAPMSDKTPK